MIVILCYHRVLKTRDHRNWPYFERGTALTSLAFESHMKKIQARFEVLDEDGVVSWLQGKLSLKRLGCWVTFDDGYVDNLEVAAPIAAKYGIFPSLFVTTGILQTSWHLPVDAWYAALIGARRRRGRLEGFGKVGWDFDLDNPTHIGRLIDGPEKRAFIHADADEQAMLLSMLEEALEASLDRERPYLDAVDLRALDTMGWRIGSHTRTHPLLSGMMTETRLQDELRGSLEDLKAVGLQHPSGFFAYPDGAWDVGLRKRIGAQASELNLHGALTVEPAVVPLKTHAFSIPRFIANADNLPSFLGCGANITN